MAVEFGTVGCLMRYANTLSIFCICFPVFVSRASCFKTTVCHVFVSCEQSTSIVLALKMLLSDARLPKVKIESRRAVTFRSKHKEN